MRSWLRSISAQFLYSFFKTDKYLLFIKQWREQSASKQKRGEVLSNNIQKNTLCLMSLPLAKSLAQTVLTRNPARGFHSLTTVQPRLIESPHFYNVLITAFCRILPSPGRKRHSLTPLKKRWPALIVILTQLCLLRVKPTMSIWDFLQKTCDPAVVPVPWWRHNSLQF